jgi:hypothetical protein
MAEGGEEGWRDSSVRLCILTSPVIFLAISPALEQTGVAADRENISRDAIPDPIGQKDCIM